MPSVAPANRAVADSRWRVCGVTGDVVGERDVARSVTPVERDPLARRPRLDGEDGDRSVVIVWLIGADIYNIFNSDAIQGYDANYVVDNPATPANEQTWGNPSSLVSPRFVRFSLQFYS